MQVRRFAKRTLQFLLGSSYNHWFGYHHCNVCGQRCVMQPISPWLLYNLQRHGFEQNILQFETQNLAHHSCSKCGASDRERLYALYLANTLARHPASSVLDIAPAAALQKWFRKQPKIRYRTADLLREDVDDRVDITDMVQYESNRFDVIICSHVLEHVPNDRQALSEVLRVLRPGGYAILMVPLILGLDKTKELVNTDDEAYCWKHYGQGDHVRLYSKPDFIQRIMEAGFHLEQLGMEWFGEAQFRKFEIMPGSVLYIGRKPE